MFDFTNANGIRLVILLINFPILRASNRLLTFVSQQGSSIIDHILLTDYTTGLVSGRCFIGEIITFEYLSLILHIKSLLIFALQRATIYTFRYLKKADFSLFQITISANIPQDIDILVTEVQTTIFHVVETLAPVTSINTLQKAFPQNILNLIFQKCRLYRKYIHTHGPVIKTKWNHLNALIRFQTN